jgi:hypothetical protein
VTFPQRTAVGTGADAAASSNSVAIPAAPSGTGANDIIFIHFSVASSTYGIATPSGFTYLVDAIFANRRTVTWWARDDGSLGGTNVTVYHINGESDATAWVVQRWAGAHLTSNPAVGSGSGSYGTTQDPLICVPGWGAEDIVWIAVLGCHVATTVTYPANYGSNQTQSGGYNPQVNVASQELNAESENPAAFATTSSVYWGTYTCALRPAAATGESQVVWIG